MDWQPFATEVCFAHEFPAIAANTRGPAALGNRGSFGSDSMRDAAVAGARFPSSEPGRATQQYSGGYPDWDHRAVRISGADGDVHLDENCRGSGETAERLRGNSADNDRVVRALAAFDISNSRGAAGGGNRILRGVPGADDGGPSRGITPKRFWSAAATARADHDGGVGGGFGGGGVHNSDCRVSVCTNASSWQV